MTQRFLNLACGDFYLKDSAWTNLDWYPHSDWVKKANLLEPLPFPNNHFDVVYTSHFAEHIRRSEIIEFLRECHRVLKPNGIIRIVVPDFENIAREYVSNIDAGNQQKAEFNIIEMIDQCVRTSSGGQLSRWRAQSEIGEEMRMYISQRTGYNFKHHVQENKRQRIPLGKLFEKIQRKIGKLYVNGTIKLLPKWFRENHINLTNTGELHRWVYDFYTLRILLEGSNFSEISKVELTNSAIKSFPFFPLDIDEAGNSRKGIESMYVEAKK